MITNLITTVKDLAEIKGFQFMYGDGRSFQHNIQNANLNEGQSGLMLNIESFNPIIEQRQYNGEIEYQVAMFMFRKTEESTRSSLSELTKQKYDNRLHDIQNDLIYFVTELTQCNDDVDLINPVYTPGLNVTAVNVDGWFISCKLKFINQWAINN